ncbi:hypothetical protein T265_07881 [Opisthorchis viverrini]|uniref:Uncharacterized protein n=1 Tax=Opisthorchis viverrini TaxID=6198 RepID=A0A074ZM58_OPIVI|nr:hypothetical protein T265_07881 [Opisthorchis viverrini]KER24455.1 hypothetical protein T265_07881 [Opisthorchis viverrini]
MGLGEWIRASHWPGNRSSDVNESQPARRTQCAGQDPTCVRLEMVHLRGTIRDSLAIRQSRRIEKTRR